jgi:hypothetical protein
MRRALGICIRRLEHEIREHVDEFDWCDGRKDALLSLINEKLMRKRSFVESAWALTARIERREAA